jgi:uncharacterized membrane protein
MDLPAMIEIARRTDGVIELVPQVGDFVARGDAVFWVYPPATTLDNALVRRTLMFGRERTYEQDPAFAFRIVADVAVKALSPAINDPTTAVLAVDQLHHLLRQVGMRQLDAGEARDQHGRIRVVYRTPDWEDFVTLAVTEVRQYGHGSIQIARRLHAMLENLCASLAPHRATILHDQLQLLRNSVECAFEAPEDRVQATMTDYQGVGGHRQ